MNMIESVSVSQSDGWKTVAHFNLNCTAVLIMRCTYNLLMKPFYYELCYITCIMM